MSAGRRADDAHPTDGVWRPLDAFVATGADPAAACPRGFTGFTVRLTTVRVHAEAWDRFYDRLVDTDAPLRIDLPDSAPAQRHRDFERALDEGPDLVGLDGAADPWTAASIERIDSAAAAANVALVLTAHPKEPLADEAQRLIDRFHGAESVVALRMDPYDEDRAEALGRLEGAGLFSPGFEFASAFRRGAGAFEGRFGLLGPAAAAQALEMLRTDLPGALLLERKLQRFAEGAFLQATRTLAEADRNRAMAETFAYFENSRGVPAPGIAPDDWATLLAANERLELFPS